MKTVADVLKEKTSSFNFIGPDALVKEALQLLNLVNLSYLVVIKNEIYQGIFSERDYTRNVLLKGRSSETTMVKEVMTTDLPMVSLDDTVETCMHLLNEHKTRYLPAFYDMKFMGVVTINDVLRQAIANKEDIFDQLNSDSGDPVF
jgi:CBS domain-containing protein